MSLLFTKPRDVRYVDMCIYIDNHIYDENRDDVTIFKYMYLLAYMLASKHRYFHAQEDYDNFASYLALDVYIRMTNPNRARIKSVLNYMKSVIYFRKLAYEHNSYKQIIDPEFDKYWDSDKYKETTLSNMQNNNSDLLKFFIQDTLSSFPKIIKLSIPVVYLPNTLVYNNLYTSSLLTYLYRITLDCKTLSIVDVRKQQTTKFDDTNFYEKHRDSTSIVLWGLSIDMASTVLLILNKAESSLKNELTELMGDFSIGDDEYTSLSNDLIFTGDEDEYTQ